ncbi:carboxylesterase/lipase family protein [Fodinicola acaciae]|uniref:carboxylesterase/lipase family protein n=1 Tax=Fodinicola acaciae TaxID=2681555 RepID=UPI0013D6968D|nr:carboxylesterase family protein [Fodinicola acaciae]
MSRVTRIAGLLIAICGAAGLQSAQSAQAAPSETALGEDAVVSTTSGLVRGAVEDGYRTFRGVPFAAPPVGALRWQEPRPVPPWSGVRTATQPSPRCAQTAFGGGASDREDCLYLDVTTPRSAGHRTPKPVMVWLHGGGNTFGNASDNDPHPLAVGGDVVVVSVNYRLGVFGNFVVPQLGDAPSFGLEDQQAALRWVRANAAAFGGDPRNVTLFGESGGALDVCAQLTSPGARGLFQRAITESGGCSTRWPVNGIIFGDPAGTPWNSMTRQRDIGLAIAAKVGCTDARRMLECLRGTTTAALLAAGPTPVATAIPYGNRTLPMRPDLALRAGRFARVPVMWGTNHDESSLAVSLIPDADLVYSKILADEFGPDAAAAVNQQYPAKDSDPYAVRAKALTAVNTDRVWSCQQLADDRLLTKHTTVFAFEFADPNAPFPAPTPFALGSYHSAEIQYLMDMGAVLTPEQQALSQQMIAYWSQFAATGQPNRPGLPAWQPFHTTHVQALAPGSGQTRPVNLAAEHHCQFWSTIHA